MVRKGYDNPFLGVPPEHTFIISAMLMPSKKRLGKIAYRGMGGDATKMARKMGHDLAEEFGVEYELSHG